MSSSENLILDITAISQELRIRPEIYCKILKNFTSSLEGKMRNLSQAILINNLDQARMILHEIKGTAGDLRLKNLLGPEESLHTAVKADENAARLHQYYQDLKREVERLEQSVEKLNIG